MADPPTHCIDPAKVAEVNRLLAEQRDILNANVEAAAELLTALRTITEQTVKGAEGLSAMIVGFDVLADHAAVHVHPGGPAEPSVN